MPLVQETQTLLKKLLHIPQQHPSPKCQATPEANQPELKKVAKIAEVLEVQGGEEVSDEEELITKLYVQDFRKGALP